MTTLINVITTGRTNQAPDKIQKAFENNKKIAKHIEDKDYNTTSRSVILAQVDFHFAYEAKSNYTKRYPLNN